MRRLIVILLVSAAAVGVLASQGTAMGSRAALRLSDEAPVAFRGSGFRAGERVKVVAVAVPGRRAVHWVTAGSGGRFVVRFRELTGNLCAGLSAIAVGNRGSRAAFKRAPGECPTS